MKLSGVFASLGLGAAGLAAWYANKLGVFRKVEWSTGDLEGFDYVFLEHSGPYNKIGSKYDELIKILETQAGIKATCETHRSVGVFYDNPETTPPEDLRSVAGVILSHEELALAQKAGMSTGTFESQKEGIVATFPLMSFWSILIGVFKAYASLKQHMKDNSIELNECLEIYDWRRKEITYFAVPKARLEQ